MDLAQCGLSHCFSTWILSTDVTFRWRNFKAASSESKTPQTDGSMHSPKSSFYQSGFANHCWLHFSWQMGESRSKNLGRKVQTKRVSISHVTLRHYVNNMLTRKNLFFIWDYFISKGVQFFSALWYWANTGSGDLSGSEAGSLKFGIWEDLKKIAGCIQANQKSHIYVSLFVHFCCACFSLHFESNA